MCGFCETIKSGNLRYQNFKKEIKKITLENYIERSVLCCFMKFSDSFKFSILKNNLRSEDFKDENNRLIFDAIIKSYKHGSFSLLDTAIELETTNAQLALSRLYQIKINPDRHKECLIDSIQSLLDRNWMNKREKIREDLMGELSEEESSGLVVEFEFLRKNPPKVMV